MKQLLLIAILSMIAPGAAFADIAVGQDAPALAGKTLDGRTFDLSAAKGQVVVVDFWATWCAPCRDELPALEAVWRQYHGQGMEVMAISADRARDRDQVAQVMHYFTYPAAMLIDLTKNEFGTPQSVPVTYVIGKDGKLAAVLTPDTAPLTEAGLGDLVKGLLAAKAEAAAPVDGTKKDEKAGASHPPP